jgi:hypothetical protein
MARDVMPDLIGHLKQGDFRVALVFFRFFASLRMTVVSLRTTIG